MHTSRKLVWRCDSTHVVYLSRKQRGRQEITTPYETSTRMLEPNMAMTTPVSRLLANVLVPSRRIKTQITGKVVWGEICRDRASVPSNVCKISVRGRRENRHLPAKGVPTSVARSRNAPVESRTLAALSHSHGREVLLVCSRRYLAFAIG